MLERIESAQPAIGTMMLAHGSEWVEVLGYAGFDFVCVDMMVTSHDWHEAANMVNATRPYRLTSWVRLPAYPWAGTQFDASLPAQVLRALSLGAECVVASVNDRAVIEAMRHPLTNPHWRVYVQQDGDSEQQRELTAHEPTPDVFPMLESLTAIDNLDDILEVEGLRMIALGMGDLTRELGVPGQDLHPKARELVGHVVARARRRGVVVCANTLGEVRGASLHDMVIEGAESLWNAGVQVVWITRPPLVVQRFYENAIEQIRGRLTQRAT